MGPLRVRWYQLVHSAMLRGTIRYTMPYQWYAVYHWYTFTMQGTMHGTTTMVLLLLLPPVGQRGCLLAWRERLVINKSQQTLLMSLLIWWHGLARE